MPPLKRFILIALSLVVFAFIAFYLFLVARDPQNYEPAFTEKETPAIAILNSFQMRPLTLGRQISLGAYEVAPINNEVEFDHTIFDFDMTDNLLKMTFNINPDRARFDPSGVVRRGTYERYYLQFSGITLTGVTADPTASLVPTVRWNGRILMLEIGEGMELGTGSEARILLETAVSNTLTPSPTPIATQQLDTIFIPAVKDP